MADTHDVRFTAGNFGDGPCVCVISVDGVTVPLVPAWTAPTLVMALAVRDALNNWGLATAIVTSITQAIMMARLQEARLDEFLKED